TPRRALATSMTTRSGRSSLYTVNVGVDVPRMVTTVVAPSSRVSNLWMAFTPAGAASAGAAVRQATARSARTRTGGLATMDRSSILRIADPARSADQNPT